MTKVQVAGLLGEPTDRNRYRTGKAWIPWYFGNDANREEWHYKNLGRVTFTDGNVFGGGAREVMRVQYDPSEDGYR